MIEKFMDFRGGFIMFIFLNRYSIKMFFKYIFILWVGFNNRYKREGIKVIYGSCIFR